MAYYVDKHPEENEATHADHFRHCEPCFPSFPTLKAARKYAEKHGDPERGPLSVLDEEGTIIPARRTRKDMQADIDRATEELARQRQRVENIVQAKQDADIAATQKLLRAGLIPLDELRRCLMHGVTAEHQKDGIFYTLTMYVANDDTTGADIIVKIVNGTD